MPDTCCPNRGNVVVRKVLGYCSHDCEIDNSSVSPGYRVHKDGSAVRGPQRSRMEVGWSQLGQEGTAALDNSET